MSHDEHALAMQSPHEVMQPLGEQAPPPGLSKKPYMPPKLVPLLELHIANNTSGGGDGDAALAQS